MDGTFAPVTMIAPGSGAPPRRA